MPLEIEQTVETQTEALSWAVTKQVYGISNSERFQIPRFEVAPTALGTFSTFYTFQKFVSIISSNPRARGNEFSR